MVKNHLKTLAAPKSWPIKRKAKVFITRPNPGAHKAEDAVSLKLLLIDMLGYARTLKEVKYMLQNKQILVDGKRRKEHRFNIGFMDTLQAPESNSYHRIIFDKKGKLNAIPISKDESSKKICRIKGKKDVGNKIQLNLDDGKNILAEKKKYLVGESLLIQVPENKIIEHLKIEKGNVVFLKRGKHIGNIGTIEEIKEDLVKIKASDREFETQKSYVIVIGKGTPLITMQKDDKHGTKK